MAEIHRQTVYKPIDFSLPNYCPKQFRIAVSVTSFIVPHTGTLHQITSWLHTFVTTVTAVTNIWFIMPLVIPGPLYSILILHSFRSINSVDNWTGIFPYHIDIPKDHSMREYEFSYLEHALLILLIKWRINCGWDKVIQVWRGAWYAVYYHSMNCLFGVLPSD